MAGALSVTLGSSGSVLMNATSPNGDSVAVNVSSEGHLYADIHDPRSLHNSVRTAESSTLVTLDPTYEIIDDELVEVFTNGTGYVSAENSVFIAGTDGGVSDYGIIRSYKPAVHRGDATYAASFTARFVGIGENLTQHGVGPLNSICGFVVGSFTTSGFGVMHRYGGRHETKKITITTPAAGAETVSLTLDGILYSIPVSFTNASDNADEILDWMLNNQSAWDVQAVGNVLSFMRRNVAADGVGAYTITSTGALAASAGVEVLETGVANTEDWTYQSNFNLDTLDGNGPSGFILNPSLFNFYQINYSTAAQVIEYSVLNPATLEMIKFHTIRLANATNVNKVNNGSLKLSLYAVSFGSSATVSTELVSGSIDIVTRQVNTIKPSSRVTTKSIGTTETVLFSLSTKKLVGGKLSLKESIIKYIEISSEATKNAEVRVYLNPTFNHATTRHRWQEVDATRVILYDTSAETVSNGTRIFAGGIPKGGQLKITEEMLSFREAGAISITRNDVLSVAVVVTGGGSAAAFTGSFFVTEK